MDKPNTKTPETRILRLPDVKTRTGLSRASIYAYMRKGLFPQNIRLGERSVGWMLADVESWIAQRQPSQQ